MAQIIVAKVVPAEPPADNGPWWGPMPRYTTVTLQGYPVSDHMMKPQLFIFPAKELPGVNKEAGQMVEALRALLASRQVGDRLPFLPLENAAQVIHSQVVFCNSSTGRGCAF